MISWKKFEREDIYYLPGGHIGRIHEMGINVGLWIQQDYILFITFVSMIITKIYILLIYLHFGGKES
jgi:hypothetical protein